MTMMTEQRFKTLAIIDNSDVVRQAFSKLFSSKGISCSAFEEETEFFRAVDGGEKFDSVIIDHIMPQIDGAELVRKVRQRCPQITLIICASHLGVYTEDELEDAGADHILMKPASILRMLEILA